MRTAVQIAQNDIQVDPGTYIYRVHHWPTKHVNSLHDEQLKMGSELICSCSDSTLRLVDADSLALRGQAIVTTSVSDLHDAKARGNITCSAIISSGASNTASESKPTPIAIAVGTSEGRVHIWVPEPRALPGVYTGVAVPVLETSGRAPVASLAISPDQRLLAVGTELHNHQATVSVYDVQTLVSAARQGERQVPQPAKPLVTFADAHSDDVTTLVWSYHGATSRYLMSGGTDAVLNVFDLAIAVDEGKDPDEALVRSLNPGSSVAHAGFLDVGDAAREGVFAVSHDEQMTIWAVPVTDGADGRPRYEDGEDEELDDRPRVYGDIRPTLDCEYVVDVVEYAGAGGGTKILGVGKHSDHWVYLIPLAYGMDLKESVKQGIRLLGAHGGEIVRSFYIDDVSEMIYTCGEDGFLRKWKVKDDSDTDVAEGSKAGPSRGKGRKEAKSNIFGRYKPY